MASAPYLLHHIEGPMRVAFPTLLLGFVCGCGGAALHASTGVCTDTGEGLDCEAVSEPATCAPALPAGGPCIVPAAEATEDAKYAEDAIRADLGVGATVRSFEIRRGAIGRTFVLVKLDCMPATGDAGHVRARVNKNVGDVFRSRVSVVELVVSPNC